MSLRTDEEYNNIVNTFNQNFKFINFFPTQNSILSESGACIVDNEDKGFDGETGLLEKVDESPYHTNESCKMKTAIKYADIKYKNQLDFQEGKLIKTPGLRYRIYRRETADSTDYFEKNINNLIEEGTTTDFFLTKNIPTNGFPGRPPSNPVFYRKIDEMVKKYNTSPTWWNNFHFSVEFKGVIIPDTTGYWKFKLTSDDSSLLWIGDNALHNYTPQNARINNGNAHGQRTRENSIYLEKGKEYPLRIQYWESGGGYIFDFMVIPPSGNNNYYYNVLFLNETSKPSMYYSLVKTIPNSDYYSCYTINPNNKRRIFNSKLKTVELNVPFLSQKQCTEIKISENGNISSLEYINNVFNRITGRSSSRQPPQNVGYFLSLITIDGKVSLNLYKTPFTSINSAPLYTFFTINIPSDSEVNDEWIKHANRSFVNSKNNSIVTVLLSAKFAEKNGLTRIFNNYNIKFLDKIDSTNYLLSSDGKFKFKIKDGTNKPVLLYSKKACTTNKDRIKYSNSTDNERYLYKLDVSDKLNKRFFADEKTKTLTVVPTNNDILKPTNQYNQVSNYAPNIDGSIITANNILLNGNLSCSQYCNDMSNNCNYYYEYTHNRNGKMCYVGKNNSDNIISNDMLNTLTPNIMESTLYVKNYKINYENDNLEVKSFKETDHKNNYSEYALSTKPLTQDNISALSGLAEWKKKQSYVLWGNMSTNTRVENFDNTICDTSDCLYRVENNKINPIGNLSNSYSNKVNSILSNDLSLNNGITNYYGIKSQMVNNGVYQYIPGDTSTEKDTIYDGINDDINEMLNQENNMYILGTMTAATMLIAAIMISMD